MPVACNESVLTGSDGALYVTPSGTSQCLLDFTDFPAGFDITVPATNDFRLNDPVTFSLYGAAVIDSALTVDTTYYIVERAEDGTSVRVSATEGGAAIALNGDGGTGAADTPAAHIEMTFDHAEAVCQVSNVQLSFTRGEVDITSLPCGVTQGTGNSKLAGFRAYQAGYADGSGSMTVRFTRNNDAVANRIIANSLFADQNGAVMKIYLNAIADGTGLVPDDTKSLLVEFPVSLLGFDFTVTPEDTPTEASVNFRLSGPPTQMLGLN